MMVLKRQAREYCGLIGIWGDPDAALKAYLALYAIQHRGQESAGIVVSDGQSVRSKKGLGLLTEVIQEKDIVDLPGHIAVGHVRYSTTGSKRIQNIQPLIIEYLDGLVTVAHNGNLTNARTIRREYEEKGAIFQTSTDSEVVAHLLADPKYRGSPNQLEECLAQLQGAFSFLIMTRDKLIAARDPYGFRPLCMGKIGDAIVVASETCALDLLHAEYIRDVDPGEVLIIGGEGISSHTFATAPNGRRAQCIFEHVYFARPDSMIFGQNVHEVRTALGCRLAEEHPVEADVVFAVPDSGRSAAIGYARKSGIPYDRGFIRNHYVGRTFILPDQDARWSGVQIKLNVVKSVVNGKRVVVVDDSIIRGTTCKGRIDEIRRAGAREVHLRISCPPTRHPCFYGIDFPERSQLIAAAKSVEEIRQHAKVDSLGYLSLEGLLSAVSEPEAYCTACFSGEYPTPVDEDMSKLALERNPEGN